MIHNICFIISLLAFAGGITAIIIIRKKTKAVYFKPLNLIIISVFISATSLFMPIYHEIFKGTSLLWIKTILISMHNAIRLFIVDGEFDIINDNITGDIVSIATLYSILAAVIFVLAPMLTFSLVLSLMKNVQAYMSYFLSYFRDIYVFSELNDESIALAASIRENYPKAKIIYTDVYESNDERSSELIQKARNLSGILFRNDIEYVRYSVHGKNSNIKFFIIGYDEAENMRQAMALTRAFHDRDRTEFYVFVSGSEGELILADLDKGKIKVRRINESRALVNRYLYERGKVLFDTAKPLQLKEKEIHVLIAGLGRYGKEMLKALAWFCQMDGYRLHIDAFDRDRNARDKLSAECPELLSEEHNGVFDKGDAEYKITIHENIDIYTDNFSKIINRLGTVTFAFVALGNDSENAKAATYLRTLMERQNEHPHIVSVLRDSNINKGMQDVHNFRGQKYDIEFIGAIDRTYSDKAVIGSDLENEALKRHLKWGDEESFWKYEYNYQSSIATTIHTKMKEYCGIKGTGKKEEELTDEERSILEELEHRRWNAYMRSEGYIYSGSLNADSRNDLGKMHHNLVPYNLLSDRDKRKDSKVTTE